MKPSITDLRTRRKMKIRNIILISDTHGGCRMGLCPPVVQYGEGGFYHHSPLQEKLWTWWNEFWDEWVPMVTEGEDYVVVHNGDAVDGVHHNSVTQITHNLTEQKEIAHQTLHPVISRKKCKAYFHIKGTEAHVGQE